MEKSSQKEVSNLKELNENMFYFDVPEQLLKKIEDVVTETDVVADIGCGIAPMVYFRPKLHLMIDPWQEYTDILSHRHADDKSIIVLRATALDALRSFGDKSVDTIFLLDVIEHMEKKEGLEVIKEAERVARQQIIIFTPLGFMSQEMELDEKDGWGLSGTMVQTHKSGWTPDDFSSDWLFYVCKTFHKVDHKGVTLEVPHGAFFGIKNIRDKSVPVPKVMSNIHRYSQLELDYQKLQGDYHEKSCLQSEFNLLLGQHTSLQEEHVSLHEKLNSFQVERATLQEQYISVKSQHTSLQSQYTLLQSQYTSLQSEHSSLQANYILLQEQVDRFNAYLIIRIGRYFLKIFRKFKFKLA